MIDLQYSAAALFDSGWRCTDQDLLQSEYNLSDAELKKILEKLDFYEKEILK